MNEEVGVDAVVAVKVAKAAGQAKMLDAKSLDAVAAHAAEPAERRGMAVDHGHDPAIAGELRQQPFDMAETLHAAAVAPQGARGGPAGMQPVGRGYRQ